MDPPINNDKPLNNAQYKITSKRGQQGMTVHYSEVPLVASLAIFQF